MSIASNIAEGQGRLTVGEFQHFVGQSRGSLLELETQLSIALDLHFLAEDQFEDLEHRIAEVQRSLNGLIDPLCARRNTVRG